MLFSKGAAQEALFRDCSVIARRLIPLLAVLIVLAGLAAACGGGSGTSSLPSGVIAQVGGEDITRTQLDTLLEQAKAGFKLQKRKWPTAGTSEYQQLQGQAVTYLVQRAEFAQKAKEMGVTVTDAQVAARLAKLKKERNWKTDKQYQDALKKQNYTDAQVRADLHAALLSEAIYKRLVTNVKVTEKEIKDYYDQNIAQYTRQQSRVVRHILVKSKATADRIYQQLKKGADFAALAKKYSTDRGTKVNGGKFTVMKGQAVPEFEKVAFELKTGELAKPVHTQYGWHVIQAVAPVKPSKVAPLKDVEKTIEPTLKDQKRSQVVSNWQADLTQEYENKIKYAKGFQPPPTQTAPAQTTPTPTSG
jgi:parvulin-like peptidyl-prolyl isomerase